MGSADRAPVTREMYPIAAELSVAHRVQHSTEGSFSTTLLAAELVPSLKP